MTYDPKPIDTSNVVLAPAQLAVRERLAEHAHDVWAKERIAKGWRYGAARNDEVKSHPCLVPYSDLSEGEKDMDRAMVEQTLKALVVLGYRID